MQSSHNKRITRRVTTLIIGVGLVAGVVLQAATAAAQSADEQSINGGTLMLHAANAKQSHPAVRLGTDMDVTVTGNVARVRVTQAFRNTSDQWMAAHYLYPLSNHGAVDGLQMVVGNKVITGHIKTQTKARHIYEKAARRGRKAGLVEQHRPNLFSTSVANIGPGQTVLVVIHYQTPIVQHGDQFSLRLPLVAARRYVPPQSLSSPAAIADAQTITASPIINPATAQKLNPVSITVHLKPGFKPTQIVSRYHPIDVAGQGRTRTIKLAAGHAPADRDFELDWRAASAQPTVGVFSEHNGASSYVMATIQPPTLDTSHQAPPRRMVFVIDNSGSMGGASMREAKASLLYALNTLRPQDHFNIIRFDDSTTQLFKHGVAAKPAALQRARRYTQGLRAGGGTVMVPALKAALADAEAGAEAGGSSEHVVRQIVFLTDGAIANEQQMLKLLGADQGRSRVFPVGIGSAPNNYLMSRMATLGRGAYTHVGTRGEVKQRMTRLLDTLRKPAVHDVSVTASDPSLALTPAQLPDLYPGKPLVLLGKTRQLSGTLTVRGIFNGHQWTQTVHLDQATPSPAIAKLWARRKIQSIHTRQLTNQLSRDQANQQIAGLGLRYSLVTSQTSLVAVDETPSRPADQPLKRSELPINLPAGWDFDALFGRHHSSVPRHDGDDASASDGRLAANRQSLDLPQTATDYATTMGGGALLLLFGLLGLAWLGRARRQVTA